MNGKEGRRSALVNHRKRRWLIALVFLGVLPLPIIAYALGVYVVTRGMMNGSAHQLLGSQLLLFLTAVLVAGAGGFLVWRTATSLGRGAEGHARVEHRDGAPEERLEPDAPVVNSVTRMLATIERQAGELDQFAERLHNANREVESAHARLREVSFTDAVTGLYNRRFFSVRLEEEVARYRRFGHPLSLVLLGLDDVDEVNSGLGPREGDGTFRGVAEVLLKGSRTIDVICRYDDHEFAVVLVETPGAGVRPYVERIRDTLAVSSFSHGRQVTASFGVASLPGSGASADDLVRAATEALHASRRAGSRIGHMPETEARRA